MKKQVTVGFYIYLLSILIPFIFAVHKVITGDFPFWYDPARDMLLAWNNLHKFTLIGPTSGIPGIFYGPYWIWLLSFAELFSKNPKFVNFSVETVPYFIIFPLILYQFRQLFSLLVVIILWILFIFSTGMGYATSLWNPNLAPLVFLFIIYFLTFTNFNKQNKWLLGRLFVIGIAAGFIINIHISFGIGLILGVIIFLFINAIKDRKSILKIIKKAVYYELPFIIGFLVMLLPFFLFEIRHGFNQTKVFLQAFTTYGGLITIHGLSKQEIISMFFSNFSNILHFPFLFSLVFLIIIAVYLFFKRQVIHISIHEKSLLTFLLCISGSILFIYLTAKNPVWGYHFIATEIIALLFIGFVIHKVKLASLLLCAWVFYIFLTNSFGYLSSFSVTPTGASALHEEETVVKLIAGDARNKSYTVFAYSPSIYIYEYAYLFKWLANKDVPYDPGAAKSYSSLVYLIIPPIKKSVEENFINYHTPNKMYTTYNRWTLPDQTVTLKRIKN